jgi:FMN reductase (NADPH)
MLKRKSIRYYKEETPSDEVVETIVRAGQHAPFASQLYSVILTRKPEKNPFRAPLLFTICVDAHKLALMMNKLHWSIVTNDLALLMFGIQDGAYLAGNMIIAAESLGLGTCLIGNTPLHAAQIAQSYRLPKRVFPFLEIAMGYPNEIPFPRPRYPLDFVLFEDEYPELDDEQLQEAMAQMDEGFLMQHYYSTNTMKIPVEGDREELAQYGWCEHIARMWGQWHRSPDRMLEQMQKCGFSIHPESIARGDKATSKS